MENHSNNNKHSKELDIVALVKQLWDERMLVIKVGFAFAIFGVFVALNTPKVYTTNVVLAPESSDPTSSLSKLGSLTSMLGLKMGATMSSDAIFPELYPQVLASTDFQISLFDVPVRELESEQTKTYFRHLIEDGFIPVWRWPQIWLTKLFQKKAEPKPLDPFHLTKVETNICGLMRKVISCVVDKKTGVITISVSDEDKRVSALMADTVTAKLQEYITMYRTKKTRNDLEYLEVLFKQSRDEYLQSQSEYAKATDANLSLVKASNRVALTNLENEMQLRYEIYSSTAQQLQLTKERLQERIPAFTTIQGATIPEKASSFPRSIMVVLYAFVGGMCSAVWIWFGRDMYQKYFRKKKKSKAE